MSASSKRAVAKQVDAQPEPVRVVELKPIYVTAEIAAALLMISRQQVDKMKKDGRLTPYYIKGSTAVRFKLADLEAAVEAYTPDKPRSLRKKRRAA